MTYLFCLQLLWLRAPVPTWLPRTRHIRAMSSRALDENELCTVTMRNTTIEVPRGTTLRTALLRAGLTPHNGRSKLINCRGLGTCGTCAIGIREGSVDPPDATPKELLRLRFPPHSRYIENSKRLRLACQCRVNGGLDLVKYDGFWGQKLDVSAEPASEFCTYFGELEFILDQGSDRSNGPTRREDGE